MDQTAYSEPDVSTSSRHAGTPLDMTEAFHLSAPPTKVACTLGMAKEHRIPLGYWGRTQFLRFVGGPFELIRDPRWLGIFEIDS